MHLLNATVVNLNSYFVFVCHTLQPVDAFNFSWPFECPWPIFKGMIISMYY